VCEQDTTPISKQDWPEWLFQYATGFQLNHKRCGFCAFTFSAIAEAFYHSRAHEDIRVKIFHIRIILWRPFTSEINLCKDEADALKELYLKSIGALDLTGTPVILIAAIP